jgi:hypothetical protein
MRFECTFAGARCKRLHNPVVSALPLPCASATESNTEQADPTVAIGSVAGPAGLEPALEAIIQTSNGAQQFFRRSSDPQQTLDVDAPQTRAHGATIDPRDPDLDAGRGLRWDVRLPLPFFSHQTMLDRRRLRRTNGNITPNRRLPPSAKADPI